MRVRHQWKIKKKRDGYYDQDQDMQSQQKPKKDQEMFFQYQKNYVQDQDMSTIAANVNIKKHGRTMSPATSSWSMYGRSTTAVNAI